MTYEHVHNTIYETRMDTSNPFHRTTMSQTGHSPSLVKRLFMDTSTSDHLMDC